MVGEGRTRKTIELDLQRWTHLRHDYVIVLWDDAADKFWKAGPRGYPNCLCNCHAFSIWCGCEHEQTVRSMEQQGFDLNVGGGRGKPGRKPKAATQQVPRGQRREAREQPPALQKHAEAKRDCLQSLAYSVADPAEKSDAGAIRPAGLVVDRAGASNIRLQQVVEISLYDILMAADALDWFEPFQEAGVDVASLRSKHIDVATLRALHTPAIPVAKAVRVLEAAESSVSSQPLLLPEQPSDKENGASAKSGTAPASQGHAMVGVMAGTDPSTWRLIPQSK